VHTCRSSDYEVEAQGLRVPGQIWTTYLISKHKRQIKDSKMANEHMERGLSVIKEIKHKTTRGSHLHPLG
jgi:hypothetical protein